MNGSEVTRDAVGVFGLLGIVPAGTATVALVAPSALPKNRLELAFPQPTGRAADAAAILLTNARVLALLAGATILAWAIPRTATWLAGVLTGVGVLNVALISIVIADTGTRALVALLPHAPLELLAYSLAGAGFLHARRHGHCANLRLLLMIAGSAGALLALAAVLEVTPT